VNGHPILLTGEVEVVVSLDPNIGTFRRDTVTFPDGSVGLYNRQIINPGCMVMPLLGGDVLLIRIFRYPTQTWGLEFPGGMIEPSENHKQAAMRELMEEIGAEGELIPLGSIHRYPSFSNCQMHLFAARIESFGEAQVDEGIAEIVQVSPPELKALILAGEITDASTLACIMYAQLHGHIT
jgi:ADP-ribose pyrophosphatase